MPQNIFQLSSLLLEKVSLTLGMFSVTFTAETTIGEIWQQVQEWNPEY